MGNADAAHEAFARLSTVRAAVVRAARAALDDPGERETLVALLAAEAQAAAEFRAAVPPAYPQTETAGSQKDHIFQGASGGTGRRSGLKTDE